MNLSGYDDALAELNVQACELINPNSLATALAKVPKYHTMQSCASGTTTKEKQHAYGIY